MEKMLKQNLLFVFYRIGFSLVLLEVGIGKVSYFISFFFSEKIFKSKQKKKRKKVMRVPIISSMRKKYLISQFCISIVSQVKCFPRICETVWTWPRAKPGPTPRTTLTWVTRWPSAISPETEVQIWQ
jgi:hypothetical protein